MLRFALSMLVAVVVVALFAGAVINGKLRIPLSFPRPAAAVAVQEAAVAPVPAPLPPATVQTNSSDSSLDTIEIAPDRMGNYETDIEIYGRTIHVMIDTGATYLALSAQDADAIGLHPTPDDFHYRTSTANGTGIAAKVHINALYIGDFSVYDVDAFVLQPGALQHSLLGMNVLSRLGGVHISDGRLVLQR